MLSTFHFLLHECVASMLAQMFTNTCEDPEANTRHDAAAVRFTL